MDKIIGIIGAMEVEIEEIKSRMTVTEREQVADITFFKGTLGSTEIVVARCGVGKVYAAACTQAMIMKYKPDCIINIGVCSGYADKLKTGDIIMGKNAVQYDMDTTAVGDPIGLISGINKVYFECDEEMNSRLEQIMSDRNISYAKGTVATGDRFINDSELVAWLKGTFNAVAGDMESGAIAHVCYINGVKSVIIRSITDGGDECSPDDYQAARDYAAKTTTEIVEALCE